MRKLTKFLCPKCFDGVYGDGMTAMRVKSSKAWRQTERTQVDRFDFSSPGFGLFHAVWDLMRDLLQAFWATLVVSGASLSSTLFYKPTSARMPRNSIWEMIFCSNAAWHHPRESTLQGPTAPDFVEPRTVSSS